MAESVESTDTGTNAETKKTRQRSPAYPAFDLRTAVERTGILRTSLGPGYGMYDTVVSNMSYDPKSGSAGRAVATLLSYGLLDEQEGSKPRKFKVSDLGNKIVLLTPGDHPDRIAALQEAARKPKIYAEILDRWVGHIPPDSSLGNYLKIERSFNPAAVDGLIADFRATYEFARLGSAGTMSGSAAGTSSAAAELTGTGELTVAPAAHIQPPAGTQTPPSGMQSHTIPMPGQRQAVLYVPIQVDDKDFLFLQRYLELMKGAIIGEAPPSPPVDPPKTDSNE